MTDYKMSNTDNTLPHNNIPGFHNGNAYHGSDSNLSLLDEYYLDTMETVMIAQHFIVSY